MTSCASFVALERTVPFDKKPQLASGTRVPTAIVLLTSLFLFMHQTAKDQDSRVMVFKSAEPFRGPVIIFAITVEDST